jgi:hypothetical protein
VGEQGRRNVLRVALVGVLAGCGAGGTGQTQGGAGGGGEGGGGAATGGAAAAPASGATWLAHDGGGPGTELLDRNGWAPHATLRYESVAGGEMRPWEGKQGYPPQDAVDGDPETFWEAGLHQETYGQRLDQWFMVDLRFPQSFSRLVLDSSTCHPVDTNHADGVAPTSASNNYPRQFKVEVSQNGTAFTAVLPAAAGTSDVTDVSFAEQTAQYLRVSITKAVDFPTTWVICELRLYR